jgi:hypothetical protein
MMTEEEAGAMWCPHGRVLDSPTGHIQPHNRRRKITGELDQLAPDHACIASACSQWRWFDKANQGVNRRGYCGLAGEPYQSAYI